MARDKKIGVNTDLTKCEQADEKIRQSEDNSTTYLESAPDGVYLSDLKGTFLYGNKKAEEVTGYKREELIGRSFLKLNILPAAYLTKAAKLLATNLLGRSTGPDEFEINRKDNSRAWVEINTTPVKERGKVVVIGFVRDITERKRIEHQIKERVKELMAFYSLSELNSREGITLANLCQEFVNILPKSWQYPEIACARIVIDGSEFRSNNFSDSAWKQSAPVKVHGTVVGRIEVGYLESRPELDEGPFLKEERLLIDAITERIGKITERKQMEQKLEEMATHDYLTGLPNRVLLLDRFTVAAALARRNKTRLAVMSLDLDKFKAINDTLGHEAGDQVLKLISTRLTGVIRASDTVARVGGDEFILMMLETNQRADATVIAQKILDSFVEPLSIDGHQLHLSTSIGVAIYPEDAEDLETLIKKSDAAMYYSKGHGRNQFKFFADGDVRMGGDHKSGTLI